MTFLDRRTVNVLLTTLFLTVVMAVIYCSRRVILVFILAILVAYLLDPAVRFLQRHSLFFKDLRGPAVVEVYLAFLILIAVVVHGVVPGPLRDPGKLLQRMPAFLDDFSNGEIANGIGDKYGWSHDQALRVKTLLVEQREEIRNLVRDVGQVTPSVIGGLLMVPIL